MKELSAFRDRKTGSWIAFASKENRRGVLRVASGRGPFKALAIRAAKKALLSKLRQG